MSDTHHAHIVIGGGISGLSAAHYAVRTGIDTLLIERDDRPGGCMHTHAFDELGGFWVEAGSHSCFNSYGNLIQILESLDRLDRATPKAKQPYKLWRGGKRRSILSALHPLELAVSLPRLFAGGKAGKSVAEYYGRGLGRKNYRDLFSPAFRSVNCQDADDFPAEALFRKKPRRKDVLRSFTMPGGLSDIPAAIAAQPALATLFGRGVDAVSADGPGFRVHLEDGVTRTCDHLTIAVPPDRAARLLGGIVPDAADIAATIGMAEIDSLLLAFERDALTIPELAGLISVDGPFLSAVSRDFLADPRLRGFAFHFPGDRCSEEERLRAACAALDTTPERAAAVAHAHSRLPSLRTGHAGRIAALDRALAGRPVAVTGNWFLGVSIEDCVTRSRAEHERLFGADGPATD
jgi:protoporphyrinogen oxidase